MGEYLNMGGYGFYVWGSYGVMAVAILIEVWLLRRRRSDALAQIEHASQEDDA